MTHILTRTPMVMPPKPAPKPLAPVLSMAEDAKRCNARMTGQANRQKSTIGVNAYWKKVRQYYVAALPQDREFSQADAMTAWGCNGNVASCRLGGIVAHGLLDRTPHGVRPIRWRVAR